MPKSTTDAEFGKTKKKKKYQQKQQKMSKSVENRRKQKREGEGGIYQRWRVLPSRAGMVQELGD